jgi:hypothetical protein
MNTIARRSHSIGLADCEPWLWRDRDGMDPLTVPEPTLGSYLARIRLERRAARLEGLVSMLRFRAAEYTSTSRAVPGALRVAVADFEHELSAIRDRLA